MWKRFYIYQVLTTISFGHTYCTVLYISLYILLYTVLYGDMLADDPGKNIHIYQSVTTITFDYIMFYWLSTYRGRI